MATIEGPLSKWTNVMKGWQYRWFVLDETSGLLSYFTSKDKMMRGARRGCVRLKGAIIGIDDEDDSTFTITVDQKTFHFQARDADERQNWIEGLENTIMRHSHFLRKAEVRDVPSMLDFERKLLETDAYLQILIDQYQKVEMKIEQCEDLATKEKYNVLKLTAEAMIEAIKHSIMSLQIAKEQCMKGPLANGILVTEPYLTSSAASNYFSGVDTPVKSTLDSSSRTASLSTGAIEQAVDVVSLEATNSVSEPNIAIPNPVFSERRDSIGSSRSASPGPVPETSYSSSEEDDFFDAEDFKSTPQTSPGKGRGKESRDTRARPTVIASDDDYFDELYDDREGESLESLEKHGSIITHLLGQVRIGMDLTKVVLPTFILERRSLLEMYADFFAHPDLFVKIPDQETPADRMIQLVRWYLSAFHAGRNSDVAKKPYNPILGETFSCSWKLPEAPHCTEQNDDGPEDNTTKEDLAFIAEQVSHHPPISAFYAEHYNKRITLDGYIWTKSKFLGLSIGVHMIGQGVVSVIDKDEDYIITFPNGYGRSILTVPWIELGGKVNISCAQTGYTATVDFQTKPFYGGRKHRVSAEIYAPNKKSICSVEGEWNGVMYAKYNTGQNEVFVDTLKMPIMKKRVKPRERQVEYDSRKLWQEVTRNLKENKVEMATEEKHRLEQRQREEAKHRKEHGLKWETKLFHEVGEHWLYDRPLLKRLAQSSTANSP